MRSRYKHVSSVGCMKLISSTHLMIAIRLVVKLKSSAHSSTRNWFMVWRPTEDSTKANWITSNRFKTGQRGWSHLNNGSLRRSHHNKLFKTSTGSQSEALGSCSTSQPSGRWRSMIPLLISTSGWGAKDSLRMHWFPPTIKTSMPPSNVLSSPELRWNGIQPPSALEVRSP